MSIVLIAEIVAGAEGLRAPHFVARRAPVVRAVAPSGEDDEVAGAPRQEAELSPLAALASTSPPPLELSASAAACAAEPSPDERRRNLILAVASPLAAAGLYFLQRANPVSAVQLLARMDERSPRLAEALESGRPTLVEFYAPWCVSCRETAPDMMKLEKRYEGRVNFVLINGDAPANRPLVQLFGVDGVPHLAMLSAGANGAKRKLAGTLIGDVPIAAVERDLDALIAGEPLPYSSIPAPDAGT